MASLRQGLATLRFEDHFDIRASGLAINAASVRVLQSRREERILRVPENPDLVHDRVGPVIHDDVILAIDHLRLVYRQTGVLADFYFPVRVEAAQVAMAGSLRERFAVLDDGRFDLFRKVAGDDACRWRREAVA